MLSIQTIFFILVQRNMLIYQGKYDVYDIHIYMTETISLTGIKGENRHNPLSFNNTK